MELTPYEKNFSQKESQIFSFVVNHQDEVSRMTIRQLAASNQTSTTTIIRFCKKFDCEGFSEFKIKLKKLLNQSETFDKSISSTTKSMRYFLERMEDPRYHNQIELIAKKIDQSELILVLGDQDADITIAYAVKKLSLMNKIIVPIQNYAKILKPIFSDTERTCCLLAFSSSGTDQRMENIMLSCKEKAITTIAVTNKSTSDIAVLADHSLAYYYTDGKQSDAALSQMPMIYIIELLFDYLTSQ